MNESMLKLAFCDAYKTVMPSKAIAQPSSSRIVSRIRQKFEDLLTKRTRKIASPSGSPKSGLLNALSVIVNPSKTLDVISLRELLALRILGPSISSIANVITGRIVRTGKLGTYEVLKMSSSTYLFSMGIATMTARSGAYLRPQYRHAT